MSWPDWTPEAISGFGGLTGGMALWFRERRLGRRDAQSFALALIEAEAKRTDELAREVSRLHGRVDELSRHNDVLAAENLRLRAENDSLRERLEGAAGDVVPESKAVVVRSPGARVDLGGS